MCTNIFFYLLISVYYPNLDNFKQIQFTCRHLLVAILPCLGFGYPCNLITPLSCIDGAWLFKIRYFLKLFLFFIFNASIICFIFFLIFLSYLKFSLKCILAMYSSFNEIPFSDDLFEFPAFVFFILEFLDRSILVVFDL